MQTDRVVDKDNIHHSKAKYQSSEEDEEVDEDKTEVKSSYWYDGDWPTWDPQKTDREFESKKMKMTEARYMKTQGN